MFKVNNGQREKELIEKFSERCSNPVLIQCLKNKLQFNSVYPNAVEIQIQEIIDKLELEESEPPWVKLLD